ncbi:uncharacterized protein METZ01_LOCUS493471, partial [marine metagenome]
TFTLSPSDNLSNYTSYKTRVTTAVKDSSGNTLSSQYESSSFTTVNTEISVVVISPVDRQDWLLGGVDNETYIKAQFSKLNEVWSSQDVGGKVTFAGFKIVDYSSYTSDNTSGTASSSGWKADLTSALMNHTDSPNIHSTLQDNLTSVLNEYGADCLIYWRKHGDGSNAVNGASTIGADKHRCMLQIGLYSFGKLVTLAHEFGHLQGCRHEYGYESPSPVTFTYVDNDTYTDYYRTI